MLRDLFGFALMATFFSKHFLLYISKPLIFWLQFLNQKSGTFFYLESNHFRSVHFHEYQLTPFSLYAAASVGLHVNDILTVLNRLSKVKIPQRVSSFIEACTENWGKVKLVLERKRYFLESPEPEILQRLLQDKEIASARVKFQNDFTIDPKTNLIITKTVNTGPGSISGVSSNLPMIDPSLQSDDLQAKVNFGISFTFF